MYSINEHILLKRGAHEKWNHSVILYNWLFRYYNTFKLILLANPVFKLVIVANPVFKLIISANPIFKLIILDNPVFKLIILANPVFKLIIYWSRNVSEPHSINMKREVSINLN